MSCCSSQTQEMWSCLIPLTLFFCNSGMAHKVPLLLLVGHYAYRSFVFPYWLQQPKPTPLHVWVAACIFVVCNGILQVGPPVQQQLSEHPGMSWSHVSTILFCSKSLCRTKACSLLHWFSHVITVSRIAIVVQGTQLVYCRHVQVTPAQTVFGTIMWGIGFAVDVQSDLILQDLRRRNPQQGVSISSSLSSLHALTCP